MTHKKQKHLTHRIGLYEKIYRRNPHLWDIDEYEPAHYYPYTALQLKRNPHLVISLRSGKMFMVNPLSQNAPTPEEVSDFQITWDFFYRCRKQMSKVEVEIPEVQAAMRKLKESIHAFKRDSDFREER